MFDFDDNPARKKFLDPVLSFLGSKGMTLTVCPKIGQYWVDLFGLYELVSDHGGLLEVTTNKYWNVIASTLGNIHTKHSEDLRRLYTVLLLQLEEEERKKGILTCYLSPVHWQILPLVLFKADKIAREYSTMQ